jgi:tetratricopeptide (TPR) repeat protein
MYGVMNGEVGASTAYLRHIWGTKLFDLEVENFTKEGRWDVLQEWKSIQLKNRNRINTLEAMLKLHPYSPELYYNLHLLYIENGEQEKALNYLLKARQIDPSIK